MARTKNRRAKKGKKAYSIIVDGNTEVWYFQMMKRHERKLGIDIKPELKKNRKLDDQYKAVVEAAENYDKVIWVVDFDTILKEDKESAKGKKPTIQAFKEYIKKLKRHDNVEVLVNTPCLEFWLLLHFKETGTSYAKCEGAEKALKKSFLKDYEKTEKYYTKRHQDIYKRLKPYQTAAISHAKKLGKFDFEHPSAAKAEIFKVLEFLGIPGEMI